MQELLAISANKRVLLVTNDFPPSEGGIQSYLRDFVALLPPESVTVFASTQDAEKARAFDAKQDYRVIRYPAKILLPTPAVARRMAEIIVEEAIDTVWFGASAPLGLLARVARKAGARRIVASTHGHEVGWAMVPVARQLLSRIGRGLDSATYVSDYVLARIQPAMGSDIQFEHLPSGVDSDFFHPITEDSKNEIRRSLGFDDDAHVIVCVSRLVRRKGQDQLIRIMPELQQRFPKAQLLIVGEGPYRRHLHRLAEGKDGITFTGSVSRERMRDLIAAADVFAMPARTRGAGLDVEGLGIVYLEAQACGIPVVAGDSGGAPETVTEDSGLVVSGRSRRELRQALAELLASAEKRLEMGTKGREEILKNWNWEILGSRLRRVLFGQDDS